MLNDSGAEILFTKDLNAKLGPPKSQLKPAA